MDVRFVRRARAGLATGMVFATVDLRGNAAYEIVQPSAWDEIAAPREALTAVGNASAFIFGSLASRSPGNAESLGRLLSVAGPLKCFDVNLRAPFVDPRAHRGSRRARGCDQAQ